jgi:hypothetical protein
MTSELEPYDLSEDKRNLLEQVFPQPPSNPQLKISALPDRIMDVLSVKDAKMIDQSPGIITAVLRSLERSWVEFCLKMVATNEFMKTTSKAKYEVVAVEGKGRGMVASRDIKPSETILEEFPLLLLPPVSTATKLFLTLPQRALEAFLLLHNAKPDYNRNSIAADFPVHRLVDIIDGIRYTNTFTTTAWPASFKGIGVILLTGALFNHSDKSNMFHFWNSSKAMYVFVAR